MTHPFLMVWLLLMIRYEFVYVYFIATKNVGDYSYMSSPNIYYRAVKMYMLLQSSISYWFLYLKAKIAWINVSNVISPRSATMDKVALCFINLASGEFSILKFGLI